MQKKRYGLVHLIVTVQIVSTLLVGLSAAQAAGAGVAKAESSLQTALVVRGANADDTGLSEKLTGQLSRAGYSVTIVELDSLEPLGKTRIADYDLLVLCDSSSLPLSLPKSIVAHISSGGDVIALRAPAWQSVLLRRDGKWIDREQYLSNTAFSLPDRILLDAGSKNVVLSRDSAVGTYPCNWSWAHDPVAGREVLNVDMSDLQGREYLVMPESHQPFSDGRTLTVLAAKGDDRTTRLAVRWRDTDGAIWTSVIQLDLKWKRYLLRPTDFSWTEGNDAHKNERFDPSKAAALSVGLSWGDGLAQGHHAYSIGYVGAASETAADAELCGSVELPDLDTLSPTYKSFRITNASELRTDAAFGQPAKLPLPSSVYSPHARPKARGFDKGREWRWAPVINSYTADGKWCGAPATLMVHGKGGFAGSIWASFGVNDVKWYSDARVLRVIGDLARRMRLGAFIMDGGADCYTYTQGQGVRLGVTLANVGKSVRTDLTARVTVTDPATRKTIHREQWQLDMQPGETVSRNASWNCSHWPDMGYAVRAELLDKGQCIDSVSHDIGLWKKKANPSFVSCKDGYFQLDGKPWRPNGVNYHPSSTVATQDYNLFLEWFGKRSYDPEIIERDLANIRGMGLDAVSVQIWFSETPLTDNLLDFLKRADRHGIKVNLATPLSPMSALDKRWSVYKKIVTDYELKDVDTVFAYDIDWEPTWLTPEYRTQWDGEWSDWVIERYGSIESAERDWGVPIPRDAAGKVTNPPVNHIQADGEWRRMSAAYLRFLNTLLYKRYGRARRLIREVDPNHPVSFRMHAAGDGGSGWYGLMTYDWPYLAAAVDFFSPEAYSLGSKWDTIKRGIFTRAYARWADPRQPMVYAETGYNLHEYPGLLTPRPSALDHQGEYFEDFYRMLGAASASGNFWWWYPGGYRCGEASDYGIINPDGSDRPATRVIRREAKAFRTPPPLKRAGKLTADTDARISSSIAGSIYDQIKDAFWQAADAGTMPEIVTDGQGTTSVNCPLLAVGNTPYNGSNPPKYLDGAIDVLSLSQDGVKWTEIGKGASFSCDASKPVVARLALTNLGFADWVCRAEAQGAVVVVVEVEGVPQKIALSRNVAHLDSVELAPFTVLPQAKAEPVSIRIRLEADGRAVFGERARFTVIGG